MAPGAVVKALLATPSIAKTEHFSLHATPAGPVAQELPTSAAPVQTESVDNMLLPALTLLVPKRHAKRAVTRNLIKRQMRDAARCARAGVGRAALLIRLRRDFSPRQFPSAASTALRQAVRRELDQLLALADLAEAAR